MIKLEPVTTNEVSSIILTPIVGILYVNCKMQS